MNTESCSNCGAPKVEDQPDALTVYSKKLPIAVICGTCTKDVTKLKIVIERANDNFEYAQYRALEMKMALGADSENTK